MQEHSEQLQSIVLPPNFVSIPSAEDGFVSLHQQTGLSAEEETQTQTSENWRSKAIRRKLSKLKELVLFIGNLPTNLHKTDYVKHITVFTNKREDLCVGPIFPQQGCLFINFTSGMAAANVVKNLHDRKIFGKTPKLIFLPFISVPAGSPTYDPLLVFINSKSGGGHGKQILEMLKGILNQNQVFLLELGGPIPGLYAFRKLPHFRMLVCGGDGTVGWVLSGLEQIHKHLTCKSPPIAVLPLGTGNDLARVLGFGSGWNGDNIGTSLAQVQEAKAVEIDRWTIFFDSSPVAVDKKSIKSQQESIGQGEQNDDHSVEDKLEDYKTVNGHRRLHRTVKYNPQRSRVNIVMGVGDDTIWQTADMFNQREDEKKDSNKTLQNRPLSNGGSDKDIVSSETNNTEERAENHELHEPQDSDTNCDKISDSETGGVPPGAELRAALVEETVTDMDRVESCEENSHQHSEAAPLKKNGDDITEFQRKSTHRKLQILSSSDILDGTDSSFGPSWQLSQLSNCENFESEEELENVEKSIESMTSVTDDIILKRAEVDQFMNDILLSELPDIINDKQKLITLLASDDAHTELDKIIKESKLQEENVEQLHVQEESSINTTTTGNFVNTYSTERSAGTPRQRALTAVEGDDDRHFGPRKKMSLPLITSDQAFEVPKNGLSDIAEENHKEPGEFSAGPKVVTMINYMGLGLDAELSLAFHLAREENPERFSSRMHNKAVYLKAWLKKITSRTLQLNHILDLEVDGVKIDLPSIKGLVFLNISSWAAGANAWGSSASRRFQTPSFGDGLLEVVGVFGAAHMSQIYSGIRTGLRIAQGEYVKLRLHTEVAVQVDGEPWMQPPGQIILTVSALQVMMLKRQKKKAR